MYICIILCFAALIALYIISNTSKMSKRKDKMAENNLFIAQRFSVK